MTGSLRENQFCAKWMLSMISMRTGFSPAARFRKEQFDQLQQATQWHDLIQIGDGAFAACARTHVRTPTYSKSH
jgi:hypothetical protein